MATSGSINFNLTRNDIITQALYMVGAASIDQAVSNEDLSYGNNLLNMMVKSWQVAGIKLWRYAEATLFFADADNTYTLSSSGDRASETVVETTLSAAEASGQTLLSVTSTTGMTASDFIGIELDSGDLQWTTISSVTSSTSVTVAVALTGAAASGNFVYSFTTKINRPLEITQMRSRDPDGNDLVMTPLSRDQYFALNDKTQAGRATQYFYDPQLSSGSVYVWPTPDDVQYRVKFTYKQSLEDFDGSSDDPDFPQEWLLPIVSNLALLLCAAYSVSDSKYTIIKNTAETYYQSILGNDQEKTAITFTFNR